MEHHRRDLLPREPRPGSIVVMRTTGAETSRRLAALPVAGLGAVLALLLPSLMLGATHPTWAMVTAGAVAVAVAALSASRWGTLRALPLPVQRRREHHDGPTACDGTALDPVHHPVRPRAPGPA